MPEVGPVEVGFLADAVNVQHDGTADRLLKREPRVGAQNDRTEVHRDRYGLIGFVPPEHLVKKPFLFQKVA